MKRYSNIILGTTLAFCMATNASTLTTQPITIGIEYHVQSTAVPPSAWSNITNAIQATLHQPVKVKEYESHQQIAQDISTGKLTMGYLKLITGNEATSKNRHVHLLASAVTLNPMTGKTGTTYNATILVAKDSAIKTMADLQNKTFAYYSPRSVSNYLNPKEKLAAQDIHVNWEKFSSEPAAFNAVLQHHADAISAWSYWVMNNSHKNQFRTISTTQGLKNPGLYVNTQLISKTTQQNLITALAHVKGPYEIVGFKG
ncbi:MAG: PhnD/SsuA/transferrin family substrate-binding protein [Gammaproteobacteria bacterium]|nr:PhnD/SsuA/transferrin family substrate-binding protein [Gammaproteobacteria bacterium]